MLFYILLARVFKKKLHGYILGGYLMEKYHLLIWIYNSCNLFKKYIVSKPNSYQKPQIPAFQG